MIIFLSILFFLSLFLLLHSYFFYPVFIRILSGITGKKYKNDNDWQPGISVLISAFNEEQVIEHTVMSILNSDYEKNKIEILVGSDKSSDSTDYILKNLAAKFPDIKFFPFPVRRGKAAVLNDLVKKAQNDILVFTDANSYIYPDALKYLVQPFLNNDIGCVCGKLVLVDKSGDRNSGFEEKKYWDLESGLKSMEGNLGLLIGANGGIYSIRKNLFAPIPSDYPVMDDFYISMKILEQRKLVVYENRAVAEESISSSINVEFNRKIRNNAIMMSSLKALKNLLKPSYGLVSFGFWSHKVIRWLSPVLLFVAFFTNLLLIKVSLFFEILFLLQICHYFLSFFGYFMRTKFYYPKILVMPFYFTMTNFAMMLGLFKYFKKTQTSFWQSTPRK